MVTLDAPWPADRKGVQEVFDEMHGQLRSLVLHYVRGDKQRACRAATMEAHEWGLAYAANAERVCDLPQLCLPRVVCRANSCDASALVRIGTLCRSMSPAGP